MNAKIRLFVDQPLGQGQSVTLDRAQAHYLFGVMRQSVGGAILLFNGKDGEWRAEIVAANKRTGELCCDELTTPQQMPPDVWLLFAPIKKARTDFIVEKAAEMGVRRIVPVITEFTNSGRVQVSRLQAHAVEAAEQCGANFVPEVAEPVKLIPFLSTETDRHIMYCDEQLASETSGAELTGDGLPWSILIGPEGGFSEVERRQINSLPHATAISLGPRILRADTAAVAALTKWQMTLGDWG